MLKTSMRWSGIAVNSSVKKAFSPSGTESTPTEATFSIPPGFQWAAIASTSRAVTASK